MKLNKPTFQNMKMLNKKLEDDSLCEEDQLQALQALENETCLEQHWSMDLKKQASSISLSEHSSDKYKKLILKEKPNLKYLHPKQQSCKLKQTSCSSLLICSQIPTAINQPSRSISISQFSQQADNLDILLFKNPNIVSKIQRFLTRSEYDHVAIVVKINETRYILESSGKYGVTLTDFVKFVNILKRKEEMKIINKDSLNHSVLAYRKFNPSYGRKLSYQDLLKRTFQFVHRVLGKKYKFTPIYLLSSNYEKKEQTYFCSELVAECLSYCQVVTSLKKPGYAYLPNDFSGADENDCEDKMMEITADGSRDILGQVYEAVKMVRNFV